MNYTERVRRWAQVVLSWLFPLKGFQRDVTPMQRLMMISVKRLK